VGVSVAAAIAAVGTLGVGCSSSKNASSTTTLSVCAQADALKQSVDNLRNVDIVKNGTTSASVAADDVRTDAKALRDATGQQLEPEADALTSAIDNLRTAVKNKEGVAAVVADARAVGTAYTNLQTKATSVLKNC
jgi:hypothetical protein